MTYFVSLFAIMFLSVCMDTDDYIAKHFKELSEKSKNLGTWKEKFWRNISEYWDSSSWQNKHHLRKWLEEKGVPQWLAKKLAQDIIVIFTDGWHTSKAILMGIVEYHIAVLSFESFTDLLITINFPFQVNLFEYWVFLFLLGGEAFNQMYYKFIKL
jgi:hypothetical protein